MRRDDILEAAIEEFGQYEYDKASINSIIGNSGTSKGTFYHYFDSKESLYLELIRLVADEKVRFLQARATATADGVDTRTIFGMLNNQVEALVAFEMAFPKYARLGARVAQETNGEIKRLVATQIGTSTHEHFDTLIKQNIEQGVLRGDLPVAFVTQLFVYTITHFSDFLIHAGVGIESSYTPKIMEYLRYYIDFLENGLANTPNSRG